MTNLEVVEEFYQEYFRSPRIEEFEALGGDLEEVKRTHRIYSNFLRSHGYRTNVKAESYEVVDQDGEVIFTGVIADIAYEYDMSETKVFNTIKNGQLLSMKYPYTLRPKIFDIELFRKKGK